MDNWKVIWLLAGILSTTSLFSQSYESKIEEAKRMLDSSPQASLAILDELLADSSALEKVALLQVYQLQGLSAMYNYQFDQANQYFRKAFLKLEELPQDNSITAVKAKLLMDIGRNFVWQSQYDTALATMLKSKKAFEEVGSLKGQAETLNAIAIIYIQYSGDTNKALHSFKKSLLINRTLGDTLAAAKVMQNLGQIYSMSGQIDSALYYLRSSNLIVENKADYRSLAIGLNIMGAVFSDANILDSSIYYFTKAIKLDLINKDSVGLLHDYSQLASVYLRAGNLPLAQKYALVAFANTKDILIKSEVAETLSELYSLQGQYDRALDYYKSFKILTDSIRNEDQREKISQLQTQYETAQKERKIELQKSEIESKDRFQLFLLLFVSAIVLFALIAVFLITQRYKLKRKLLSLEIDTLRSQIDSIFGGGVKRLDISLEEINRNLFKPLSDREYEILQEAISDKNNKEIAENLFVSVNTVKYHLRNIYEKLGVSNRKEALKFIISRS